MLAETRSSKGVDSIYHHVDLAGLRPDTTYQLPDQPRRREPATRARFTTAPAKPEPFRFAAFGDMGVNAAAAAHVRLIRDQDPAFAFVVGDLCYADSSGGTGAGGDNTQDFADLGPLAAPDPAERRRGPRG